MKDTTLNPATYEEIDKAYSDLYSEFIATEKVADQQRERAKKAEREYELLNKAFTELEKAGDTMAFKIELHYNYGKAIEKDDTKAWRELRRIK